MDISGLFTKVKKYSEDNKYLPIKVESVESLRYVIGLLANRSNNTLKAFIKFDHNGNNTFFDAFTHLEVKKNLKDFLSEDDTSISIVTNCTNKFSRLSEGLEINSSDKLFLYEFPQEKLEAMEAKLSQPMHSFILGDKQSLMIGHFDFNNDKKHTFVNFSDSESAKKMLSFFNKAKSLSPRAGENKK
ncbi:MULTISPECIES: hypothetical protein [Pseudoalteromonas]|uniref:hypothetical protein n=1 Tax=Pseudoalteromonas TaxID=53246 RepID=UPI00041F5D7D|nr:MULTISPECIES: hypothetical protein [Pseudoalteromonas]PKG63651.1 hypothetical protein CXF75_13670 [Pseudoalteromonas arctica]PKG69982.1 hypothetical protein CXF64_12490 [Pseudoalteromonas sp. GutCa3]